MNTLRVLIPVLLVAYGIIMGLYTARKRIVIRGPFSLGYWVDPTFFSMMAFCILFMVDLRVSACLWDKRIICDGSILYFAKIAVCNGALIVLSILLLSIIFEHFAKKMELVNFKAYSQEVPKLFFVTIIMITCSLLIFNVPGIVGDDIEVKDFFYNKLMGWIITVVGIVFGIDYGYKRRIKRNNDNKLIINWKRIREFWMPFVICIVILIIIVLVSLFFPELLTEIFRLEYFILMLVSFSTTLFIVIRKNKPSVEASKKIFDEAVKTYLRVGHAEGLYRRNSYTIDSGRFIINKDDVVYQGHEDDEEFKELFGERIIEFEDRDVISAKDLYYVLYELKCRYRRQSDYLAREIEACNVARWEG